MKEGWKSAALGEVLALIRNGTNCDQTKSGQGCKISRIETISAAVVNPNKVGYAILSDAQKANFKLRVDDILFSHINSSVHVGKVAIVTRDENIYHGINLLLLRPTSDIEPHYLYHYMNYMFQDGYWRAVCKQSVNQASVNQTDIKKVRIVYPKSTSEQKRIVDILDEAFKGISTAAVNAEKNLASARELLDSYVHAIFAQQGKGWVEKKLGEICENLDSKRVPITKSDRVKGEIPYYGASGIVDYVSGHLFDEDILLISEDGANLLARTYPIAFSVTGKSWVNNHAHVVRFNRPETQKVIELYLNSISLAPYISGMAQPKLNQKSLNAITVPVPPTAEQVRIVETAETLQAGVERLEEIYREKLAALADLKQNILQKAFAGELSTRPVETVEEAAE